MLKTMSFINVRVLPVLILLGLSVTSRAVDFEEVIRNPSKFHDKRVTLVAMADVGGDRFYLYRPPKPEWSIAGRGREIYGVLSVEGPIYDRFDDKWIEVTGIIDANYRGLASDNACSLIIEQVRPAGKIQGPELNRCGGACLETQFPQLLKHPRTFEHGCVCVTGFAHVLGDAFVIYESEKAAAKRDIPKGIFVKQKSNEPNYNRYNNRWIKITGTVEMNERGWANYPCGIIVERVEPVSARNTGND
jgi:hypothetical protein